MQPTIQGFCTRIESVCRHLAFGKNFWPLNEQVAEKTDKNRAHVLSLCPIVSHQTANLEVYSSHPRVIRSGVMSLNDQSLVNLNGGEESPEFRSSKRDVQLRMSSNHSFAQEHDTLERGEATKDKAKKREVYRHQTDWLISSLAWSAESGDSFNLALSSYIEDYSNRVQLISLAKDNYEEEIESITSFEHPYPATKILWNPKSADSKSGIDSLLATTADYLRLWRVEDGAQPTRRRNDDSTSSGYESHCHETTNVKLECL